MPRPPEYDNLINSGYFHPVQPTLDYVRQYLQVASGYLADETMNLRVVKWGNSLAVRIPAEYARLLGIKEDDRLEARLTVDGGLTIRRPATWNRKAFARELAAAREAMPMGTSVMDEVRRE